MIGAGRMKSIEGLLSSFWIGIAGSLIAADAYFLYSGWTLTQIALVDTLIVVALLLLIVLALLSGRMATQIPQNSVGAVFIGGRRQAYVVGNQEDMDKLTKIPKDIKGNDLENPNVKLKADKILVIAGNIPFLTNWFNIQLYSWNPFAYFKPVQIYKHHWKRKNSGDETKTPISEKIEPGEAVPEKFLWIDSVVIGSDTGVELQGNLKVNYVRQSNVRVGDLDEVWLAQNGRWSSFVDETIRSAFVSFINTLVYPRADKEAPDDKLNFQKMDFSENPENDFNKGINSRITGRFAIILTSSVIVDWDLNSDSKKITEAINDATAAGHERLAQEQRAIGEAALVREKLKAEAQGNEEVFAGLLRVATAQGGQAALQFRMQESLNDAIRQHNGTLVINSGTSGGVTPMLPLESSGQKPQPQQKTETKTEGETP